MGSDRFFFFLKIEQAVFLMVTQLIIFGKNNKEPPWES